MIHINYESFLDINLYYKFRSLHSGVLFPRLDRCQQNLKMQLKKKCRRHFLFVANNMKNI